MAYYRISLLIEFGIEAKDEEEAKIKAMGFDWREANDAEILNIEEIN